MIMRKLRTFFKTPRYRRIEEHKKRYRSLSTQDRQRVVAQLANECINDTSFFRNEFRYEKWIALSELYEERTQNIIKE